MCERFRQDCPELEDDPYGERLMKRHFPNNVMRLPPNKMRSENQELSGYMSTHPAQEERIWLKQTHEENGWKFGYYCDKPQDDAFIEYVRVNV